MRFDLNLSHPPWVFNSFTPFVSEAYCFTCMQSALWSLKRSSLKSMLTQHSISITLKNNSYYWFYPRLLKRNSLDLFSIAFQSKNVIHLHWLPPAPCTHMPTNHVKRAFRIIVEIGYCCTSESMKILRQAFKKKRKEIRYLPVAFLCIPFLTAL